jgi:glutaredoxin-related protein
MLKIYGSNICIDCRETFAFLEQKNIPYELVDITDNTANLKEFLSLRDHEAIFLPIKEKGSIGIPFFVCGDKQSFVLEEALSWI